MKLPIACRDKKGERGENVKERQLIMCRFLGGKM
jgi:hypothetical protein